MSTGQTEGLSPQEVARMLQHIQEEINVLRSVLLRAMPKDSPEWHRIEHEQAAQALADKAKRKSELYGHLLRTAAAAALLLLAQLSYNGFVSMTASAQAKQTEVSK